MAVSEATYTAVRERDGWNCVHCGMNVGINLHHMMPKTKANRSKYPNFIDSENNLVSLCGLMGNNCHGKYAHMYKRTEQEAADFELILGGGR